MGIQEEIGARSFVDAYHEATINIVFTANWLTHILEERASQQNITLHQFNVLRVLRGKHPEACTNREVQSKMVERNSDVSRMVNRLVTKGLIHRSKNDLDGRAVALTITDAGLEILEKLEEPMLLGDLLPGRLSESECEQLNALLDKLRG